MGFKGRCLGVPTRVRDRVPFVHEWRDFDGKPTDAMLADKFLEIKGGAAPAPPADEAPKADKPKTTKRSSRRD